MELTSVSTKKLKEWRDVPESIAWERRLSLRQRLPKPHRHAYGESRKRDEQAHNLQKETAAAAPFTAHGKCETESVCRSFRWCHARTLLRPAQEVRARVPGAIAIQLTAHRVGAAASRILKQWKRRSPAAAPLVGTRQRPRITSKELSCWKPWRRVTCLHR